VGGEPRQAPTAAERRTRPGTPALCASTVRRRASRRPIRRPAAGAERGEADHREDDRDVLHDQEPDRDAPVQRVDLALVREQLDDDDRAREGERDGDVGGRERRQAQRHGDPKPITDVKTTWPMPVASATGPSVRIICHVELEADDEQQQRDADAGEQLDLLVLR
jgi:hypothetical protein